ncbi:MAG: hypothetical protein EZS28_053830, partial [Streblomastix strix]
RNNTTAHGGTIHYMAPEIIGIVSKQRASDGTANRGSGGNGPSGNVSK